MSDESEGVFIMQPGSTVATSISKEETGKKCCAIVTVKDKKFKSRKIELITTRQVILEDLELDDSTFPPKMPRTVVRQNNMADERLVMKKIEDIILSAKQTKRDTQPQLPRVRLRVTYSGKWLDIPPLNGRKVGVIYNGQVANPTEMIVVRRKKTELAKKKRLNDVKGLLGNDREGDIKNVDEMVEKYFSECPLQNRLIVLSEIEMGKSIKEYSSVEGSTYGAVDKLFSESIKDQMKKRIRQMNKTFHGIEFEVTTNSLFRKYLADTPMEETIENFCRQELSCRARDPMVKNETLSTSRSVSDSVAIDDSTIMDIDS